MKRLLSSVLAVMMLMTALTGCGPDSSKTTGDDAENAANTVAASKGDGEGFTIGFPWATSSTDPTFVSIVNNVRAAVESAGGTLVLVESDLTADNLINNIADLISRDVDGIIFMPASDSMLPTVNQMCTEAGVYYSTMFRVINDDLIREEIQSSAFFAGSCYEDDALCAYNITKSMVDQGVSNLCVINIAKGDTSSDLRDSGIEQAIDETGIKLLNTTYGVTAQTDMTKTIESYIAAYPEMDGILIAGTYCDAALPTIEKALADHNMSGDIIVGRIDFDSTMGQYLENGSFHVAYGGQQQIDPLMAAVILVNQVMGHPIKSDGPFNLVTGYLELTSAQEADDFLTYFLGDEAVFSAEEIKDTMIKAYDDSIDENTFIKIVEEFSVSDVATRHAA